LEDENIPEMVQENCNNLLPLVQQISGFMAQLMYHPRFAWKGQSKTVENISQDSW
jgi:hypothetical protein